MNRLRSSVGMVVLASGLVIALVGSGVAWTTERQHATQAEQQLDALRQGQTAQQAQLADLAGKLTAALGQLQAQQTRLKADEKQLDVTTKSLPPDLVALAGRVTPSVVQLICATDTQISTGTGFALAITPTPGYQTTIVTAAHVVTGCETPDGGTLEVQHGSDVVPVHLRSYDAKNDVAILDTKAKLPALKPAGEPVVGAFVMAVGYPLGLATNVTSGSVSGVSPATFLNSAPISSGNSGGPLVDRLGRAIGIVDAAYTPQDATEIVENLNVALRLSILCEQLLSGDVCLTLR